MVFSNHGQSRRRLVVLSCPGLGRLLGLGSGGKRRVYALAAGDRVSPLRASARAPSHAQGLDPLANHNRLQPDHLRHFFNSLWNSFFHPCLFLRTGGRCLSGFSLLGSAVFIRFARLSLRPTQRTAGTRFDGEPRVGISLEQHRSGLRVVHYFSRHDLPVTLGSGGRRPGECRRPLF